MPSPKPKTRRRSLPGPEPRAGLTRSRTYSSSGKLLSENTTVRDMGNWDGRQITVSQGNPISRLSKGELQDIGGPFRTEKSYTTILGRNMSARGEVGTSGGGKRKTEYFGPMLPHSPKLGDGTPAYPPSGETSDDDLEELGAQAIAECKPTNSLADLSVALGEIMKEGLPSLVGSQTWKDRALTAKNAGSEYLNVVFGWQPLYREVSDFVRAVQRIDTVLKQYERDAGKVVRRQREMPIQREVSIEQIGGTDARRATLYPNSSDLWTSPLGTLLRTRETVRRRWFSGAFTYHLPTGYDSRSKLDRYRLIADILGIELTPETIWNVSPWSWAVDWFSNAGDVISNISDFATGGLVMPYGYMMEHSIVKDTYRITNRGGIKTTGGEIGELVLTTEVKKRIQANPYGFGVSWDDLSSFQTSVLVALGLSRRS